MTVHIVAEANDTAGQIRETVMDMLRAALQQESPIALVTHGQALVRVTNIEEVEA